MLDSQQNRLSILTYASVLLRVAYTTFAYWTLGLTPEQNHGTKGYAWSQIGAYRFAAWNWRKYLKYSEDSMARTHLGWCYANMGMIESAAEHYRLAYARNKDVEIALFLAGVELDLHNLEVARALLKDVSARRDQLRDELRAELAEIESRLTN